MGFVQVGNFISGIITSKNNADTITRENKILLATQALSIDENRYRKSVNSIDINRY